MAAIVPRDREALEELPGVGRKTANVVLNVAFGEPTIAVDTHIFRVGNRTGLAPGKTPLAVEQGLEAVTPAQLQARRPSLADPARPPCLQGEEAGLSLLRRRRSVSLRRQDAARRPAGGDDRGASRRWRSRAVGGTEETAKAPAPTLPRKRGRERVPSPRGER